MKRYKRVSEMTLEEKREKVAKFNVMDDVFFQKMMEDKEVCEEILRIIIKDSGLKVIKNTPQASIKNIIGKSVVLDALCQDKEGKVYKELPDVKVIFISRFDVFHGNHAMYHVDRVVRETGQRVENGQSEIYVNAKIQDGTPVADLMEYFVDSNGKKEICPKLSERVMLFKTEQEEVTAMCELMEQERLAGREEGREAGLKEGLEEAEIKLLQRYMQKHQINFDEAFEILGIEEEKYDIYRDKIEADERLS